MKKITFLILMLAFAFSIVGYSQINTFPYVEDFESGDGGWTANNGANGTWALGTPTANVINSAASGSNAWTTNLTGNYNNSENSSVVSPVFDFTSLTAPAIEFSIWWNSEFSWDGMVLQSSIDSGTSWQNVGAFGDPNNWYNDTTINGNPGGQQVGWTGRGVANGSQGWRIARHALIGLAGQSNVIFRFAFGSDTSVVDNGVAFDLINIFDVTCPEPNTLAGVVTVTDIDLTWNAGGSETSWEFVNQVAGTPAPTDADSGTQIGTNFVQIMNLVEGTNYQFYVRSDCGADGFSPWVGPFNYRISGPGETCGNPIIASNPLPYITDDNTSNYGDDYSGAPGTSCGTTSPYLNGDDVVYSYTPINDTSITITLTPGGTWSGLFVYDDCADIGTNCLAGVANSGSTVREIILPVTGGTTYYIVISTFAAPQSIPYNLTITENTCTDPVATYTVESDCVNGPQFFVDVNLSNLGSATSIIISDNQGSTPQTTGATGVFNFGPYPNATNVVFTVANADDANCIITSPNQTQPFCLDTVVDCDAGPINVSYCFGNSDTNVFQYTSSNGLPLNLTINSGGVENNFDELVIFDSDGVTNLNAATPYGVAGNISGLTFQSSGDTIYFAITSDTSVSCSSGSFCCVAGIDYTVSCATCINPIATYAVVDDCDNGDQFLIDVNVTSLGDATSLTISNNINASTVAVPATGTYQIGPFPFLTDVVVTVSNDQDVNCVINSNAIQLLACPPDNDNCDGAIQAVVNPGSLCDAVTPGTIIAATPSGVPNGSCTGNPDDDVWFQFTALDEVQLISLINITGGTTNLDHAVYSGSCGTLTELYCSPNASSVTPLLVVGNTYYIRVFSGGSIDETSSFDLCIQKAPENTICEQAANFCGDGGPATGSNITGFPSIGQIACLFTTPNPSWNIIQIGDPGDIEIQISQVSSTTGAGLDVDFVLWGPFDSNDDFCLPGLLDQGCPEPANCPNNTTSPNFYPFGNIIDCSYSFVTIENLTIENALSGQIYVLLVTNFSNQAGTITIEQTNAGGAGAGSTVAEIQVDLGGDQDLCGFDEIELVADSPFADRYEWYEDGFLIDGETGSTLTVTQSNIYTVIAYDDNCDAVAQDEITVNFYLEPTANPVADIVTCDDASGDNIEDFDLESQTAGVLGAQNPADFAVTYHLSIADAQNAVGALTSPYNNITNPQTIYVRVEDIDAVGSNSGCFATTSFDLIISGPTPTATSADMELCDDISRDGFESFTLTDNNANILDGQDDTQFVVSYYASEADANAGVNSLASPYTNLSNPQTIWARVESNVAFDCYSVIDFDLIVLDVPFATFNSDVVDYEVCPNATVPIEISLVPNGYTQAEITVQWERDNVVIPNQSGLTLPVLTQGEYTATITFNDTQCSYEVSATVIELESCVIPQGISPNNDGLNDSFDLSSYDVSKLEIFNRNGTMVYSKSNYSNEWFGQTNDGDELPVGTYFYSMIYQGGKEKTGWVYINR